MLAGAAVACNSSGLPVLHSAGLLESRRVAAVPRTADWLKEHQFERTLKPRAIDLLKPRTTSPRSCPHNGTAEIDTLP